MRLIMPYNNKMNNKNQKRAEKFKENNKIKAVKDNHQKHNFNSKEAVSFDYDVTSDINDALSSEDRGLIVGRNPVIEALKAEKQIDVIYVNKDAGGSINLICRMAKEQGIVIKQVSDTKLSYMSNGASHQGVIASGACAEYVSIEDILAVSKNKGTQPFIIVCDEIEDPHNLGAIIRTAEAAGADGIIIPKRRSASLNQTVFKTSAGAASWLPVARVSNIAVALDMLKENGVWIYGTDADGEDYTGTSLTGSIALVIGSEGNGIGRLVREKCDFLIKLPMLGKITSLNASVAAGIFMYEAVRQRQSKSLN
jgi:23S rRNA (guanosine2251-2'-O)-methyltransferase